MLFLFLFFLAMPSNYLITPVVKEKIKVKLALAIPTGAPTTLVKEMIELHQLLLLKQLKSCLCNQRLYHICLIF